MKCKTCVHYDGTCCCGGVFEHKKVRPFEIYKILYSEIEEKDCGIDWDLTTCQYYKSQDDWDDYIQDLNFDSRRESHETD